MRFLTLALLCGFLTCARAQNADDFKFKLNHVFQDHMVLQAGIPVPIWGQAPANTEVSVSFSDQSLLTRAGEDGFWRVNLKPLDVSLESKTLTVATGKQTLVIHDVLVGEVWLCAGQSNMAWLLGRLLSFYTPLLEQLKETDLPLIRFIAYTGHSSSEPLQDMDPKVYGKTHWQLVNDDTVRSSMGLPFFFANKLYQELKIPIGLVQIAVGATSQTAWSPREVIAEVAAATDSKLTYDYLYKQAQERKRPRLYPGVVYNAQLHPLAPLAFRGMIWHQGEGGPSQEHAERMAAMVNYWRKLFENDFYFIWGGLSRDTKLPPPYKPHVKLGYRAEKNIAFLRAQKMFGYDSRAIFCDFYDLGNFQTHFGAKDKAGERLALAALTHVYDRPHNFTGPQIIETRTKPGEITLKFMHVGGGLVYQPTFDGITGFVLEADNDWSWIAPEITAFDTLTFKSHKITANSKIYYAYHPNPHETLFSQEGFPASILPAEFKITREADSLEIIKIIQPADETVWLNVIHTRRNVLIFNVVSWAKDAAGVNRVRIHIPCEWEDAAARHLGKPVRLNKSQEEQENRRIVELDVLTNSDYYIIYNSGKEKEAMIEADLTRF